MISQLPQSLTQPVEARALSFFLSKYIVASNFEYLASIYTPHLDREEQFSKSIEAVGLASLANELESFEISKDARKRYIDAIKATNTALQSPLMAKKDSTLLAVLLLTLFEVITCTTRPSLCLWESHIKGALALVRLRGPQQMQSQLGIRLLNQATASAAICAHRNQAEVSTEIISFVTHGLQYANTDDPSWSFRLISCRSAKFRAAVKSGELSDPDVIIATAVELDRDFVAWSKNLPSTWQYEIHTVERADPMIIFEGCYHLYSTHGTAQGMNTWRMSRLQLNEMIWTQYLQQQTYPLRSQNHAALMHQVRSTITDLCSEICATVPQYVELPVVPLPSACKVQSPSSISSDAPTYMANESRTAFTHSARSYGIIWPLMVVANCVIPHSPRRAWVINRLQYISRHMKNPQAQLALEILEGKKDAGIR